MIKDIYNGQYAISDKGEVFSHKKPNTRGLLVKELFPLKPIKTRHGYLMVEIRDSVNKTHRREFIHRLVAKTFLPEVPGKTFINHIDGNKTNNSVTNLEWCTFSENMLHGYRTGLYKTVPILKYDKEGNFIKEYSSIKDAVADTPNSVQSLLIRAAKGRRKSHAGYIWRYK